MSDTNTKPKRYRRRRRRKPRNKNNDVTENENTNNYESPFHNEKDYPPLESSEKPSYASTARNWGRKLVTPVEQKVLPVNIPVKHISSSITIFMRANAGLKELNNFPYFNY